MERSNAQGSAATAPSHVARVWCLAGDVHIVPIAKLPESVRRLLLAAGDVSPQAFGLQRRHARMHPKVISPDVVEVLHHFGETGATYAEVLQRLATARGLDPAELDGSLRDAVTSFVRAGILVDAGSAGELTPDGPSPALREGDELLNCRIARNVHCLVDCEVYQVADLGMHRTCALKIMRATYPTEEMRIATARRLEREFSILARLHHPSVVRLLREGVYEGRRYGVLEWIEGPPVTARAQSPEMRSDPQAQLALAIQCVAALRAVHAAGFLHGDVHPGNFLAGSRRVRLIDFGLARPIHASPAGGAYEEGGVLFYMPPEYARKIHRGDRSFCGSVAGEIYSCGVMLFVLFTGQLPYAWKTYREEFLDCLLNDPPRSFSECGRSPWPALERLLQRALNKTPERRFASLGAYEAALRRLTGDPPEDLATPAGAASGPLLEREVAR